MISALPLAAVVAIFALCALAVTLSGVRMTSVADRIADRSGFGEAVVGGVLLGAATSLSGSVASFVAALDGHASLAFSNGVGGIAAQTAFLAVADIVYRRANLEHAAAELANIFQCGLLLLLLTIPVVAFSTPEVTIWSVHPASLLIPLLYLVGIPATLQTKRRPMWTPVRTDVTRTQERDAPDPPASAGRLAVEFAALAATMSLAGWLIAKSGVAIADRGGVSETAVGALMTAVATSLPELVTCVAAVRRGALQLAVGGIIGGNSFDTLFLTLSDIGYRDGSLYHAVGPADLFWLAIGACMSSVLLMGLVFRQERGPSRIGVESLVILVIYLGAVAIQATA